MKRIISITHNIYKITIRSDKAGHYKANNLLMIRIFVLFCCQYVLIWLANFSSLSWVHLVPIVLFFLLFLVKTLISCAFSEVRYVEA